MSGDFTPTALWPVRFPCDVSTVSPTVTGMAVGYATDTLWALSGRQFGLTTVTLRPVRWLALDTPFPDAWLAWPGNMAAPASAASYGTWWGWDTFQSGCGSSTDAHLPAPVKTITQVKVDGVVLDPSAYHVDNNRILRRIDGLTWPTYNNMLLPDTQIGTWSVTATYGQSVPDTAAGAVGELACEFLRAMNGEDCRLPKNVTSIARQGVTITLPDVTTAFSNGLTGLRMVDLFILTWNPGRLRRRAKTYSVDQHSAQRTSS